jgi:hypothetical protein
MAELFWVTFRIEENAGREARYRALQEAVSDCANGKWWDEPTSFILFQSGLKIGQIAERLEEVIDTDCDVAVIGMPDYKSARAIGAVNDPDLFNLWSWVKRA